MKLFLRAAGVLLIIVSIIWWFVEPGFTPIIEFLSGLISFGGSFAISKKEEPKVIIEQRTYQILLDHVEIFWVKGILEKSLHRVALMELGMREDRQSVSYPWTVHREVNNEPISSNKSMLIYFTM